MLIGQHDLVGYADLDVDDSGSFVVIVGADEFANADDVDGYDYYDVDVAGYIGVAIGLEVDDVDGVASYDQFAAAADDDEDGDGADDEDYDYDD